MQALFPWEVILIVQQKRSESNAFFCKESIAVPRQMLTTPLLLCKVPLHCYLCSFCYRIQKGFGFFYYELCCKLVLKVFVSGFGSPHSHLQLVDCCVAQHPLLQIQGHDRAVSLLHMTSSCNRKQN